MELLTKDQITLLKAVGKNRALSKRFYLTGGTPLAAFYLQHRYSEDLDFFSEDEVDPLPIQIFFKQQKGALQIKKIDFEQSFNRNLFFLTLPTGGLKIEFTYFPFPRIARGVPQHGVQIDSILDIAVNKLFAIYQRTQARDYIDLYYICRKQKYTIEDLLKKAKAKFDWHVDPIQLGTQFAKAEEASDLPRMIQSIPRTTWQTFFLDEAQKLRSLILE